MTKRALILVCISIYSLFIQAQNSTGSYQLLWEISGKGMEQPSYLFGTIHLNDERVFNLPDSAIIAFNSVDAFAMEVHPDTMVNFMLNDLNAFYSDDVKFSDLLEPKQYQKLQKEVREATGMADLVLDDYGIDALRNITQNTFKPGEESTILDMHFFRMSQMQKKPGYSLEPIEVQLKVLKDRSHLKTPDDIRMYLGLGEEYDAMMDTILQLYLTGDIDAIDGYMNDYEDTAYVQKLLYDRNVLMAENMQQVMKSESGFFAVGAGHLGGEQGVVQLLRKAGYNMRPVKATYTGMAKEFTYTADMVNGWTRFNVPELDYSMDFPGRPSFVSNFNGQEMEGYVFIDLRDMTVYFTVAMELPVVIDSSNYETFRDVMLSGMAQQYGEQGKLEMTEVMRDGAPGVNALMPLDNMTAVSDILFNGKYLIMNMIGRQDDMVPADLADRFLSSFKNNRD